MVNLPIFIMLLGILVSDGIHMELRADRADHRNA